MEKEKTKKIALAAMFLAICIICTIIKRMSVMLSGSIVNTCLILATQMLGMYYGIVLSVLVPIFSYFITHNPIQSAVPLIVPLIMVGNAILCIVIANLKTRISKKNELMIVIPMVIGSVLKALFMGIVIAYVVLPTFLPEKMKGILPTAQFTFSFVQLFTALIGSVISTIIYRILNKIK